MNKKVRIGGTIAVTGLMLLGALGIQLAKQLRPSINSSESFQLLPTIAVLEQIHLADFPLVGEITWCQATAPRWRFACTGKFDRDRMSEWIGREFAVQYSECTSQRRFGYHWFDEGILSASPGDKLAHAVIDSQAEHAVVTLNMTKELFSIEILLRE